jgi:hypothetical protein
MLLPRKPKAKLIHLNIYHISVQKKEYNEQRNTGNNRIEGEKVGRG